jgi:hypothetical protein
MNSVRSDAGASALARGLSARRSARRSFGMKNAGHRDFVNLMDHVVCANEAERGKPEPDLFMLGLHKWEGETRNRSGQPGGNASGARPGPARRRRRVADRERRS